MAQRPEIGAGITEGNVLELHIIAPVGALLGGEAALIHCVGDIQKYKGLFQIRCVGLQNADHIGECKHIGDHRRGCTDILGAASHIKCAAQRF